MASEKKSLAESAVMIAKRRAEEREARKPARVLSLGVLIASNVLAAIIGISASFAALYAGLGPLTSVLIGILVMAIMQIAIQSYYIRRKRQPNS